MLEPFASAFSRRPFVAGLESDAANANQDTAQLQQLVRDLQTQLAELKRKKARKASSRPKR